METQIFKLLGQADYVPLAAAELLKRLGLPAQRRHELHKILSRLEQLGRIARLKGDRYGLPLEADLIPGRIRMNRQGKGFLDPDDPKLPEIAIPAEATSTALHGDRVLVRRDVRYVPRGDRRDGAQGKVVRVLQRARTQLVGTLQRSQQFLYVIPDDPRIPHDIYVPPPRDVGRQPNVGDKVVVELRQWESRHTNPEGEIVEVLGPATAEGVDMLCVLRHYNLPLRFPPKVLSEARAFGTEIRAEDVRGRIDCRDHSVVTIDPDDAKDFDDAICLTPASHGQWKLWVHIADVSHYVKPGTALDAEARRRGNSTYLVDRVIPMLPEALSNELCSLKPHVDRLTKCVEFLLNNEGKVLRAQFYSAVICSKRRFTYREVFAILQRPPSDPVEEMLHQANDLAQKIRRARFKAGSLDLDFPETKIRLDNAGRIERIEKVENDISHQLIEEFMLLANEAVAARLQRLRRPAIYRVHESPSAERLRDYREEVLLHQIRCGDLNNRREVQRLLEKLNHVPFGRALKIGFLKSLMRARYAVEPLGHYGLAKENYAHFTSPIRRYADLAVHRALFSSHDAQRDGTNAQHAGQPARHRRHSASDGDGAMGVRALTEIADHISETERNSADAERDSKDVKLFAHLRAQLESNRLERYRALVIDVRNFGFFVEVSDLGLSGLVHLSSLTDDFYLHDPARALLVGRRSRRVIKLGDELQVQVAKLDTFKKQVDFKLVDDHSPQSRGKRLGRKRRRD